MPYRRRSCCSNPGQRVIYFKSRESQVSYNHGDYHSRWQRANTTSNHLPRCNKRLPATSPTLLTSHLTNLAYQPPHQPSLPPTSPTSLTSHLTNLAYQPPHQPRLPATSPTLLPSPLTNPTYQPLHQPHYPSPS